MIIFSNSHRWELSQLASPIGTNNDGQKQGPGDFQSLTEEVTDGLASGDDEMSVRGRADIANRGRSMYRVTTWGA